MRFCSSTLRTKSSTASYNLTTAVSTIGQSHKGHSQRFMQLISRSENARQRFDRTWVSSERQASEGIGCNCPRHWQERLNATLLYSTIRSLAVLKCLAFFLNLDHLRLAVIGLTSCGRLAASSSDCSAIPQPTNRLFQHVLPCQSRSQNSGDGRLTPIRTCQLAADCSSRVGIITQIDRLENGSLKAVGVVKCPQGSL